MNQSRVTIQLGEITNSCFVVMPFASMFDREYTRVIRPAIQSVGLECVRGDEIYSEQSIVQDIWKSIRTCRVMVAELSGRNPNVMYEVGLAHALGKPIILLTRKQDDVPFDLKSLRYVYYDTDNPEWGADLRTELVRAVGKVLENPSLSAHLNDVKVETKLPNAPDRAVQTSAEKLVPQDLAGVWRGSWISVNKEREHTATLVIPEDHGVDFTASLTVAYWKESQQTVVEETLKAFLADSKLHLTGVNYTYVERGASVGYTLDKFDLVVSSARDSLEGNVTLKHGVRAITFRKAPALEPPRNHA
ncbi:MAG: nucleoside 2-deoxyribosyltransferase [Pseudomonadota bacterium]